MKLLLYCTKAKPYLYANISALEEPLKLNDKDVFFTTHNTNYFKRNQLNGKIVAECDFEVEKIETYSKEDIIYLGIKQMQYDVELLEQSCLSNQQMNDYLKLGGGYAIHIKNLHIFDEPKELSDYFTKNAYKDINKIFTDEVMIDREWYRPIEKAPQNIMYAQEIVPFKEEHLIKGVLQEFRGSRVNEYILISIQPQWLCKILNGEKTIEVRKKVLKEMLG